MGYLKTCTSQSKQNALLNIRAIPLYFDENYLSWYHNEQIYPLKDYFSKLFTIFAAKLHYGMAEYSTLRTRVVCRTKRIVERQNKWQVYWSKSFNKQH